MEEISKEKQYVDLHPECFGKQNIKKTGKIQGYGKFCQHDCRLKQDCINASREKREDLEYQASNISYDSNLSSDCDDRYDEDGAPAVNGGDCFGELEPATEENNPQSGNDYIEAFLKKHNCPVSAAPAFRAVLEQFFVQEKEMPRFSQYLSNHVFSGMSQADYARKKGITRAAVGMGISLEIAGINRMKVDVPDELDPIETVFYILSYREGLSSREVAKRLNISKGSVYRLGQLCEVKIGKNGAVKKNKTKKIKKKLRRTKEQIERDNLKLLKDKAKKFDMIMKLVKGMI